ELPAQGFDGGCQLPARLIPLSHIVRYRAQLEERNVFDQADIMESGALHRFQYGMIFSHDPVNLVGARADAIDGGGRNPGKPKTPPVFAPGVLQASSRKRRTLTAR